MQNILDSGSRQCEVAPSTTVSSQEARKNMEYRAMTTASELDAHLRDNVDKKHGTTDQRLALTYKAAQMKPNTIPFVPRLLWHRFYNYNPGLGESSQEDASELLKLWLDDDPLLPPTHRSPLLHKVVLRTIRAFFVCQEQGCKRRHPLSVPELGSVIPLDLLRIAPQNGSDRIAVHSVQEAFDMYFEETPVETSDRDILLYNGRPWRCEQCGSNRLPRKQHVMEKFPNCLVLHLKRWETEFDAVSRAPIVKKIRHTVRVDASLNAGTENYALRAIVRHRGSDDGNTGHYVTMCKFPGADNRMWLYNDGTRRETRDGDFDDAHFASYVVLYDRIDSCSSHDLPDRLD